jgi:hypothetical protein
VAEDRAVTSNDRDKHREAARLARDHGGLRWALVVCVMFWAVVVASIYRCAG